MQFISVCLFTIILGYSVVISAPVNQTSSDSEDIKHQKATDIANRLLKELANEQSTSQDTEEISADVNNKDTKGPVNHPSNTEKVQTHIESQSNLESDESDEDADEIENPDSEYMKTLYDLYELYGNNDIKIPEDDESSEEYIDDDYALPLNRKELMKYLIQQENLDDYPTPMKHTPVMDDTIMTAENHRRRRRSIHYD